LLADKFVVGLVFVEGGNDVIAVAPGKRLDLVELETIGLGIAHNVEPMARPFFAILRTSKQIVDEALIGVLGSVVDKRFDLRRRRRQADQVIEKPARERQTVGRRGRRQFIRFELGQDERIDWIADPCLVLDEWGFRPLDGAIRPILAVPVRYFQANRRGHGRDDTVGPGRSRFDPARQDVDFFLRELRAGRHLQVVLMIDRLEQSAVAQAVERNDRSGNAAFENAGTRE
jgi:hypothetical protein